MTKLLFMFTLFVLLLLSCSQEGATETKEQPTIQKPVEKEEPVSVVVSCEDTDGEDIYTKGKAVLTYDNDQKESFKDRCIEEGSIFPVFLLEYTCEDLNTTYKIHKCDRNCSRGACNR